MTDDREPTQWVSPGSPEPEPTEPDPPYNPYNPQSTGSPYGQSPYAQSAYGRFPAQQPVPPPSQAMAGWALGLSFVPCVITLLLSVIFAIVALVRSTAQSDYGRRKAIAALCIVGVWVLVFIALVIAGVAEDLTDGADRNDEGVIEQPGEVSVFDLRAGDCWQAPEGDGDEVLDVEAVPCDGDHQLEVYAVAELPAGEFAGTREVERLSLDECIERFESFVGRSYRQSSLDIFYLIPNEKAWALGETEVTCSVFQPIPGDFEKIQHVRGTLRGADR